MLRRIQAVLSPVGWGTCNSLCSQSTLYLSLTDCFYLFLYPLSLCLAPEQTAHHSLLCSANTKFQTLPSSFCRRQQMQFFSIVLNVLCQQHSFMSCSYSQTEQSQLNREKLPVRRGNQMSPQSWCLYISQVFVSLSGFRRNCLYVRHRGTCRSVTC